MTRLLPNPFRNSGFLIPFATALLVLLIPTVMNAAKPSGGGKPPKCPAGGISTGRDCHIPVTTYINDVDSSGFISTISSDGQGGYVNNADGVGSWLTDNGYNNVDWDWQFGVYGSPSRRVNESTLLEDAVQPGDPHYTAPASPPFGFGTQTSEAHIEVKCTLVGVNLLVMTPGQTRTCPLINKFNVNGQDYWLGPALSFTGYAETTDVQVRCNTADSTGCNDWFIDPINLGQAVGRLAQGSTVNYGDFYMRFNIHITRP
jgi:hypothetical protein